MALTLPWIAFLAALAYLVASETGLLDDLARRHQNRGWRARPKIGAEKSGSQPARKGSRDRLRVFEEFLNHLPRDDGDGS